VLVGVDGDLSEAERSRLDIQSVTVCVGKCELKDDEGETDEDGVDDEENRLCRTCGHLLPMIDLPTIEAACRAAPTGLCPCCGLEDDAQTSMARPCGVCRSSWLLRNHNSDQRSWKEAEAAPVEDFGEGPYTDLATEEPDTPNRETTGHRTQDHARSPEAHCEVPSPGTPQALRERRTAAANARTERCLLPELERALQSRQQARRQRKVQSQPKLISGWERSECVDCQVDTENVDSPNHCMGEEHTPKDWNYDRIGQLNGANDGVARLPAQSTPLLTYRDSEIFGRGWDGEEQGSRLTEEDEENDGGGKQRALGNRTHHPARPHTFQPYNQAPTVPPPSPVYVPCFRGTQLIADSDACSNSDKDLHQQKRPPANNPHLLLGSLCLRPTHPELLLVIL
jgi:hypothetical protein